PHLSHRGSDQRPAGVELPIAAPGPLLQLLSRVLRTFRQAAKIPARPGASDRFVEQPGLGAEVAEERDLVHPRKLSDPPRGGTPEAGLGVELGCGVKDSVAGVHGDEMVAPAYPACKCLLSRVEAPGSIQGHSGSDPIARRGPSRRADG